MTDTPPISPSSNSNVDQRQTRQLVELCAVCGDISSGYHYGALTCEACKAFFWRKVLDMNRKPAPKRLKACKFSGSCVSSITIRSRNKCKSCRFKKCRQIGMLPGCVLAPSSSETPPSSACTSPASSDGSEQSDAPLSPSPTPATLGYQDKCAIQLLLALQDKYEKPSELDIRNLTSNSQLRIDRGESADTVCSDTIIELAKLTVELIVEFAKELPGFSELKIEDQQIILQACSIELMTLRAARRYVYDQDCIIFANEFPYRCQHFANAGLAHIAEPLFRFCRELHVLKLDNVEYALLSAIKICSKIQGLENPDHVEKIQEFYLQVLKNYTDYRCWQEGVSISLGYSLAADRFEKLIQILSVTPALGQLNCEDCFDLVWHGRMLPPLLIDAYDSSVAKCVKDYNGAIEGLTKLLCIDRDDGNV